VTVVVSGATGLSGGAVVDELVAAGVPVRALTRSPQRRAALERPGVEALAVPDPAALAAALRGARAAYLATPAGPDPAAAEGAFARAAAAAGVPVVKLSTLGADPGSPLRFARAHAAAEAAVREAGGSWTFLRPTGFMQNDLAWAAQLPGGAVATPAADAEWSVVDVRDVAAVAAAVLREPGRYAQRALHLTGPRARSPRDRVRALAALLGRELAVVDVPVATHVEQLRAHGVPAWVADGLGELARLYATGAARAVLPDLAAVLGRPGRSWEGFLTDHRSAWGP
jgi:uncharacterized protein YbjT (DUF2867 family)